MQRKETSEAYLNPCDHQNFSVAMHVGFGSEDSGRNMKIAVCVALYTVLLLIWMPGFGFGERVYTVTDNDRRVMRRKVLKPPPEKPLEQVVTKERKARKLPMPDLTPDAPEPDMVALAPPVEMNVVATDDWEIGIPDEPVAQETIALVGNPGVEAPVFTKRVQAQYPQKGVALRLQGYVILEAVLRKNGSIDMIQVLRGLGRGKFGFEDEAISSLRKWQFLPGMVDGVPSDVRMNLRVDFILN